MIEVPLEKNKDGVDFCFHWLRPNWDIGEPVTKIVTHLYRSGQFPALARLQG